METYSEREYVELFHLLFLSQLGPKIDKRLYSLKGGCNLRFYHNSPRYSEDIDIDIQTIAKGTLQNKVGKCLDSTPFKQILISRGMKMTNWSDLKQTATTQKWKIGIQAEGISQELRTQIEFSRRELLDGCKFGPVTPAIIGKYALPPILVNHYPPEIAFQQKINALATRNETQARDVFDLDLILGKGIDPQEASGLGELISTARDNAINIPFGQFKSQVLAYLPPDQQTQYDSESIWEDMTRRVTDALEKALK